MCSMEWRIRKLEKLTNFDIKEEKDYLDDLMEDNKV